MLNSITSAGMTTWTFLLCILLAVVLGIGTAIVFSFKARNSASMALTLSIMPAAIAIVIMMVNGNVGAGVAVAGAFTLVRFRSVPGTAREIADDLWAGLNADNRVSLWVMTRDFATGESDAVIINRNVKEDA